MARLFGQYHKVARLETKCLQLEKSGEEQELVKMMRMLKKHYAYRGILLMCNQGLAGNLIELIMWIDEELSAYDYEQ